jgi:hypothetical protein
MVRCRVTIALLCWRGCTRSRAPWCRGARLCLVSLIPGTGRGTACKHRNLLSVSFSAIQRTSCRLANESAMGLKTSCRRRTAASTSAADQHNYARPPPLHTPDAGSPCAHRVCNTERTLGKAAGLEPMPGQRSEPSMGSGRRTSPFDPQVGDALAVV